MNHRKNPTTSHQPPATSHQPPATSHQPPATSHQPPTPNHQNSHKKSYIMKHPDSAVVPNYIPWNTGKAFTVWDKKTKSCSIPYDQQNWTVGRDPQVPSVPAIWQQWKFGDRDCKETRTETYLCTCAYSHVYGVVWCGVVWYGVVWYGMSCLHTVHIHVST